MISYIVKISKYHDVNIPLFELFLYKKGKVKLRETQTKYFILNAFMMNGRASQNNLSYIPL